MSVTGSASQKSQLPLTLRANFTWTLAGNVVYAAAQWAIVVLLAKIASVEVVGQFSLALAVTAPVFMLTNLQLRAVQTTDARGEFEFGSYLALRLLLTAVAFAGVCVIAMLGAFAPTMRLLISAVALAKSFEALSDIAYGLLQKSERMDWIAKSMILKGALSLIALTGVVLAAQSIVAGTFAMALVWFLLLVLYDLPKAKSLDQIKPRFVIATLRQLAGSAVPLGIVMMLLSLSTNIPRYFVEDYWGQKELGYFAALSYLMVAGTTVVGALGQSASPRLSRHYAAGDRQAFIRLLLKLCVIGLALGLVSIFIAVTVGKPLLSRLYRPDYAQYSSLLSWMMGVSAVSYVASFLGYGMTAARSFRSQLPLFIVVTTVILAACALLIPSHGLIGAAWAMGIGSAVQLLGAIAINMRAIRCISGVLASP